MKNCEFRKYILVGGLILLPVDFQMLNCGTDKDISGNSLPVSLRMPKNKSNGKPGVNTPSVPTTPAQQTQPPQQPKTNCSISSGQETSHYLSEANNVLYAQGGHGHANSGPMAGYMIQPNQPNVQGQPTQVLAGVLPPHLIDLAGKQQQYTPDFTTSDSYITMNTMNSAVNLGQSGVTPWLSQMFQKLDGRLQQIESQLLTQNSNWQHIDNTLKQQTTAIEQQNNKILHLEKSVTEINAVKTSVSQIQSNLASLDKDVNKINTNMLDYDLSIQTYSDLCDDVIQDRKQSDTRINELCERMDQLEGHVTGLSEKQSKIDDTVVDLQCRSMRDNLIFTGIQEVQLEDDEYEDVEKSLNTFLEIQMGIRKLFDFHRVHRLGAYKGPEADPRPIIAKFEHFKDREYVRSQAPKTLRDKPFGIREQFPKVVEDKRKLLYPEMKKAKLNPENKVRLVKDKLYINKSEFVPKNDDTQKRSFRNGPNRGDQNRYTESRTFYRTKNRQSAGEKYRNPPRALS